MAKYRLTLEAQTGGNYLKKDCIREGEFIDLNTKKPLSITRDRLSKWCGAFKLMQQNGVNVPIADGHNTKKPLGSISDMYIVNDTDGKARLWCEYNFADEEAVQKAKRAKYVSIATDPAMMDCDGNKYGEVIQHVAITATPVISNQKEYIQLSRIELETQTSEESMEFLKELAKILGVELAEDATEDAIMAKVKEATTKAAKPAEKPAELDKSEGKPEDKPAELSLDSELADALTQNAKLRLADLVAKGNITPAVSKELQLSLVGDAEKVNVLTLSKGENEKSLLNTVVDILAKNDPVELGKKTEKQIIKDGEAIKKPGEKDEADAVELERQGIEDKMKDVIKT